MDAQSNQTEVLGDSSLKKSLPKFNSRQFSAMKNKFKQELFSKKIGKGQQLFKLTKQEEAPIEDLNDPEVAEDLKYNIRQIQDIEKDYQLCEILGEGGSAVVKMAIQLSTQKRVAIKIVKLNSDESLFNMKYEFKHMKQLPSSELIVQVYEMLVDNQKQKVYTVMELVEGVEMFEVLAHVGSYNEQQARCMFRQILQGIRFLHLNGVCHRDLKPNNILVCSDGRVKITDFNVSKFAENIKKGELWKKSTVKMMTYTGTFAFKAPEMYSEAEYTEIVDMWSAGVILYTMLSGNQPFNGEYLDDLIQKIMEAKVTFSEESWNGISKEAQDLVKKLLEKEPEDRIDSELTFLIIISTIYLRLAIMHPWINNQQISEKELPKSIFSMLSKNQKKLVKNAYRPTQSSYVPPSNFVLSFLNSEKTQQQTGSGLDDDEEQKNEMIGKLKQLSFEQVPEKIPQQNQFFPKKDLAHSEKFDLSTSISFNPQFKTPNQPKKQLMKKKIPKVKLPIPYETIAENPKQ